MSSLPSNDADSKQVAEWLQKYEDGRYANRGLERPNATGKSLRALSRGQLQELLKDPFDAAELYSVLHPGLFRRLARDPFFLTTPGEQLSVVFGSVASLAYGYGTLKKAYFMQKFATTMDPEKQAEYAARAYLAPGEERFARYWASNLKFRGYAFLLAPLMFITFRFSLGVRGRKN